MITTESFPPHPPPIANTNVISLLLLEREKIETCPKMILKWIEAQTNAKIIEHCREIKCTQK